MALPIRRKNDAAAEGQWGPFGELLAPWTELPRIIGGRFTPLADIEETDDAYHVELELSGVKKDDIELQISKRHLTVTGERKEKERAGILRRRERVVGRFSFEVTLPGDVEEDAVEATLDEGVLAIRVPKVASDRPRRIEVRTARG